MTVTAATFGVLLLLFPGLLASAVLNVARRPGGVEPTQRLVETLLFALVITGLTRGVLGEPDAVTPIGFDGERLVWQAGAGAWFALSAALAVGFALATSWVLSKDRHMAFLRVLRVTDRSSYQSMWHRVFAYEGDRFIVVHLEDGRRVQGYASHYARDEEEGAVFLDQPAWLEADEETGTDVVTPTGQYGLLVPGKSIELIEFQFNVEESEERERLARERAAADEEEEGRASS